MNEARHTSDREQRERVLQGLGAVRDPDRVRQVLALTLDERLDPRETVWLLFELGSQRETRRTAFDFLTANYETLVARLPRGEMSPVPYLPWVGAGLCEADTRQEIGGFFEKRSASVTGAPRVLAQILESVDQCVALKRAQQKGLAAYLVSLKGR
jgi:alanyl aminopeptidase